MAAAANNFPPKWVMLERFVSLRDDDESFTDEGEAPITIRASGITSWKAPFSVTFKLAEPPVISRLYAKLPGPGFPGRRRGQLLSILATHQHLALFRVNKISVDGDLPVQDLFIFSTTDRPCSLKLLPHCTLPNLDVHTPLDGRPSGRPPPPPLLLPDQRVMSVASTGLLCQGEQGFVVAEANLLIRGRNHSKLYADIFWLRSSDWMWNSVRTRVLSRDSTGDFRWETDAVIPVRNWLCWIDYYYGILLGDMFHEPTPTVTLVRLPPEEFPSTELIKDNCWMYRSVSAIDAESCLKFVKVDRNDCVWYGPLKEGAGFTITCHTLMLQTMAWKKDYTVTSKELWSTNFPEHLPHDVLMFPQVNIDRPHIIHFLMIGESKYLKKNDMWVVTIDLKAKKVDSFYQYINGREVHGTEDANLAEGKSDYPLPFLPAEFSKFLHL